MTNLSSSPPARPPAAEAGFSLIEALIASVIILMIFVGVLPLFSQAMLNNTRGNDSSRMTNATVDRFEDLLGMPFNSQITNVVAGNMLQSGDAFLRDDNIWVPATYNGTTQQWDPDLTGHTGDAAHYTRIATVEQFSVADLEDDMLCSDGTAPCAGDEREPAGTARDFVHLKRFTLEVRDARWVLAGGGSRAYEVITVQSF